MPVPRNEAPRRYLIVTHEFAPVRGGAATYAEELGHALHQAGVGVTIWAPDYARRDLEQTSGCPVVRVRTPGKLGMFSTLQFARSFATRQAELEGATVILTSVGAHMAFMLLSAQRLARCRRVISVLHGSEVLRFERSPLWKLLARRFYRRVKCVATVSEFSRCLIANSFLDSVVGKVTIAPCAGTTSAAKPAPPRVSDGNVRVLTLARIHPRKGQLDTAQALAKLPLALRQRVTYQIGGTGDERYLAQVKESCLQSAVKLEYLGEVKPAQLAGVYAGCDLYVQSSRSLTRSVEGFGITYLDASFHGKPVVGYRSGGVAEAVVDGETGLLVTDGDVNALARAIERLITDEALRARLGDAGKSWATKFSWANTAAVFQELADQ